MQIAQNNTQQLLDRAKAKLMRGIENAVANQADRLRFLVTRKQVVNGENRSVPGEYPARETGLLERSIGSAVTYQAGIGIVGVSGTPEKGNPDRGGLPLMWLEDYQDRLGMRAAYHQFEDAIKQEIIAGAKL